MPELCFVSCLLNMPWPDLRQISLARSIALTARDTTYEYRLKDQGAVEVAVALLVQQFSLEDLNVVRKCWSRRCRRISPAMPVFTYLCYCVCADPRMPAAEACTGPA
jgi:hypothetical protein